MIHNEHINMNADFASGSCSFDNAEGLHPDEFCVNIEEDPNGKTFFTAEICEKIPNKYRYST